MNFSNVGNVMYSAMYQNMNRTQNVMVDNAYFAQQLQNSDEVQKINSTENALLFSQIFSKISGKEIVVNNMFSSVFPANDVEIKTGNCNVSNKVWERKDFPVWQYFHDNVSADSLNYWKPKGAEPTGAEPYIQKELGKIHFGEMVIIIPESLQKKMESDPEYAWGVLEKVQKWKTDYDRMDNAIAASYGDDPALYQMTKSYCIKLDEDGNVGDYTVIGGGMDTRKVNDRNVIKDKAVIPEKSPKAAKQKLVQWNAANFVMGIEDVDYEKISPYVTVYHKKRK